MTNSNAIVSVITGFEPPLDRTPKEMLMVKGGVTIKLDKREARLNPESPTAESQLQVLIGLSKLGHPVYLELDPDTAEVQHILVPEVTRISNIEVVEEGGLSVGLERSHAKHMLPRDTEGFDELEKTLRSAMESGTVLIITEDDRHNIIDICPPLPPIPGGPEVPRPPFPPLEPPIELLPPPSLFARLFYKIWYFCWWPWWWFRCRCITMSKAQTVFNAMKATSCDPLTIPAPCIPFLYPDDGCWARAHEMCRLMINIGLSPKKVWIQGGLHVDTANSPYCYVNWGWHVAPTLCVRGSWFFTTKTMVIDPSLFDAPVSKATWKSVQGDTNATLTDSSASIYYLWGSITDPNYIETNYYLSVYRLKLQARAITFGSPPYANCP